MFVEWRVNNGSRDLGMVYGKSFFSPQTTEKTFLVGITDDEVRLLFFKSISAFQVSLAGALNCYLDVRLVVLIEAYL